MPRLTKAEVAAKKDLAEELVPCPEWGGEILMRELDGKARAAFVAAAQAYREKRGDQPSAGEDFILVYDMMLRLVSLSAIDPETEKATMFTPEDLAGKSGDVVQRLSEVAMRISKLGAAELKKETENLPAAQSGASSTD